MTQAEKKLLGAMKDFMAGYGALKLQIEEYERSTGKSVNDLPGFTESYPFESSFDELDIERWVDAVAEGVSSAEFKVLRYDYMNTGGNCMVGIFEVWLPEEKRVVYALTNEEGCTLSVVDYVSNELEIHDYDELMIDNVDWGRVTGYEKYFELYRHCLNEFTKSECRYFKYTRQLPVYLLSDDLQGQITDDYKLWMDANEYDTVETDGYKIIVSPYYEIASGDEKLLNAIKAFKHWHYSIAGCEEYYEAMYKLEFADHKIEMPFMADVFDAVDTMLKSVIRAL